MKKTIDRLKKYIDYELLNPQRDSIVWITRWRLAIDRIKKSHNEKA